ncbi:EexN family lipoprotein [Bartonella vinsonii]|uniref:Lipoprotein n=1 Tax=Bartonella vinsonii subsp. berkhoffii str. Tweed TaxID=1094502 RepID=N6VMY8_BARVB|nr:EexN family lipoprotein [Bartonella vinsonii]ENN94531.1 hypothetical protein BVtw_13080 [Bartonella vinsonii subsp. berkhoffii str. Tweed]
MKKIIITALLLCIGFVTASCEKTYSVAEFKKDKKLMEEWGQKCEKMGPSLRSSSKNCQNLVIAAREFTLEGFYEELKKE